MAFASNTMTNMTEAPTPGRDWTAYTKQLLRAEMVKRGVNYKGLVEKLAAIGVKESEANLRNKISRGGFTASFFVQCLYAMGAMTLRLDD
jgi:hypothetical protein